MQSLLWSGQLVANNMHTLLQGEREKHHSYLAEVGTLLPRSVGQAEAAHASAAGFP